MTKSARTTPSPQPSTAPTASLSASSGGSPSRRTALEREAEIARALSASVEDLNRLREERLRQERRCVYEANH
jgi:hypothetical protein